MQASVAVMGTLKFPPGGVERLLPHLKALIEASRLHEGCLAYDAAEDFFEPGVVRISELWQDQQCLDRHVETPDIPPWFDALRDAGVQYSQYLVCAVSGIRVV